MPIPPEQWTAPPRELARAMDFLREHLPLSDLDCYPQPLFLRFARHAAALREHAPWCAALDWEMFAHYVLFPRVNDEDLSFHRDVFFNALWPRMADLPCDEARALEVNRWCCEQASYQAQDQRTAAPLTVYRCGSGRCGEESAFLVSALRSVGLAARQVYAPRWSHCDDNHAWVEVLCGGRWRFLGACEPEPLLDRGWFNTAASRAVLAHSRVFGKAASPLHGEALGENNGAAWFNQTARYASTAEYTFRALCRGRPAAGAKFHLQILNEARFHTIAVLTAGQSGTARAALGRGSLHVLAVWGDLAAEGDCGPEGVTLHLAPPPAGDTPWTQFDFRAPADSRPVLPLDGVKKSARAETLRRAGELRQKRLAGYSAPGRAAWEDLRLLARGNWDTIRNFMEEPGGGDREKLVRTLSEKDLRDVTPAVLQDHFSHLPPRLPDVPESVYWQYAACPRVALEPLTPWRAALLDRLSGWDGDLDSLPARLGALEEASTYGNLYWTPAEALKAGRCDRKSRRLLFVAALRAWGIPARLSPLDGSVERWEKGRFRPVDAQKTGILRLEGSASLRPGQDWSIARRAGADWTPLSPGDGEAMELPAGQYRVITTVRLPAGDQLAQAREIRLNAGAERSLTLSRRPWSNRDLLSRQPLPALAAAALDGQAVPDLFRMGGLSLVLWAEEGGEPTEHVLNELAERAGEINQLPVAPLLLLRSREALAQPTLAGTLARLSRARVLLDDWAYDLEAAARCLGRDPDMPPLCVLCDGQGNALYSAGGYQAGGVELLLRAIKAAVFNQ